MPSPSSSSATSSFQLSGNSTIDPLLDDTHVKWGGGLGTGVSLTFSFPWINGNSAWWQTDYSSDGEQTATYHFGLSPTQMAATRSALQTWANVANISFGEVADTSSNVGDFRFAFSSALESTTWGRSSYPSNYWAIAADVWINSTQGSDTDWYAGTSNFGSLIHEVGHGLGLKHPGNYNGTGNGTPPFIQASLDFRNYSIMSYQYPANNWYWDSTTRTSIYVYPETPMVYDIQAIQYLYGANTSFHAGNDSYTFSPTTPFYKTIWDAGGTDTIDVSNFSLACSISLIPGTYSSIAYYSPDASHFNGTNDLGIAFGATIENAIGGSGNDTLIGNNANNSLDGGAGNDTLYGGPGNDIFDWSSSSRAGDDIFYGGTGDDTFVLNSRLDSAIEYFGEGSDTVWASFDFSLKDSPNIENLRAFGSTGVSLVGNDSNNVLSGSSGNDIIDGGIGNDVAVFSGKLSTYNLSHLGKTYSIRAKTGTDGTDTLTNVESLKFNDMTVNLTIQALAAAAPQANVQRLMELYIAFFNRVADADGLSYWIGQMTAGQSTNKIADTFYGIGAQYSNLTGFSATMSNSDFINVIYRNVLGRIDGADAGGLTYWNGKLLDGSATRGSLVSTILDAAHGYKGDVTWGWVANLLDNKITVAKTFAIDWGLGYSSADDSITHGMAIAKAVTSTDTATALSLIGISPIDIHLT